MRPRYEPGATRRSTTRALPRAPLDHLGGRNSSEPATEPARTAAAFPEPGERGRRAGQVVISAARVPPPADAAGPRGRPLVTSAPTVRPSTAAFGVLGAKDTGLLGRPGGGPVESEDSAILTNAFRSCQQTEGYVIALGDQSVLSCLRCPSRPDGRPGTA